MTAGRRLLVVATGSPSTADLPSRLFVLRKLRPDWAVTVVLTRSATRFVTPEAVAHRSGGRVLLDEWETGCGARHVELAQEADAVIVHPATLDYLSRVAAGRGDSPSVLALQCTAAPVVLAPALPPGGVDGPAYRRHWTDLTARPNTAILPPAAEPAISTTTGETFLGAPGDIVDALDLIEQLAARPALAVAS